MIVTKLQARTRRLRYCVLRHLPSRPLATEMHRFKVDVQVGACDPETVIVEAPTEEDAYAVVESEIMDALTRAGYVTIGEPEEV